MKVAALAQRVKGETRSAGLPRPRKAIPPLSTIANSPLSPEQIPNAVSELYYYATLLQQLHVRHKNQHRGQLWFKQLGLLRRALRDLYDAEIGLLYLRQAPDIISTSAQDMRSWFDNERLLLLERERMTEWTREVLIPECYVRFSVLVADGDGGFANLGVVLVAAVAGLSGLVGLPKEADEEVMKGVECSVDVEAKVLQHQKQANARSEVVGSGSQAEPEADTTVGDDFGTVIDRAKLSKGLRGREDQQNSAKGKEQDVKGLTKDEEQEATDHGKDRSNASGVFSKKIEEEENRDLDTSMETASREESSTLTTTKVSKYSKKRVTKKKKKNAIDNLFEGFA